MPAKAGIASNIKECQKKQGMQAPEENAKNSRERQQHQRTPPQAENTSYNRGCQKRQGQELQQGRNSFRSSWIKLLESLSPSVKSGMMLYLPFPVLSL